MIGMIGTVIKNKHTGDIAVIVDERYEHGIGMGGILTPVVYTLEDEDGNQDVLNAGLMGIHYEIIKRKGNEEDGWKYIGDEEE